MPFLKVEPVNNLRVVRLKLFEKKKATAKDKKHEGVFVEGRVGNQRVKIRVPGL